MHSPSRSLSFQLLRWSASLPEGYLSALSSMDDRRPSLAVMTEPSGMIPPDEVCTTRLRRPFAAMPPVDDTLFNSTANTMRSAQSAVSPPDDFDEVSDLSNALS